MYHVTKVSAQNPRPNWNTIEPVSIANDKTYDGDLLGLPLASFTTTQWLFRNNLPTISPYPRDFNGTNYEGKHHRVKLNFNIHDFDIFWMGGYTGINTTQVQLLCIRKEGRNDFEDEVYKILSQHYPSKRLAQQPQQRQQLQLNTYFPGGAANIYDKNNKKFVNVHFTYSIPIPHINRENHWDTVQKKENSKTGEIKTNLTGIGLEDLRLLWCIQHYYKEIKDAFKKIKDKLKPPIQTHELLKSYQSELTSEIDELTREIQRMNIINQ